jgi:hypothetical protein
MKAKVLIIALAVVLCFSSFTFLAKCEEPAVKVAVYWENENIDSCELLTIENALAEVENRFLNQLGHAVDFEIVGSWTSSKNTEDDVVLISEAISKTDGVYETVFENGGEYLWKFKRYGYTAAIYFVDQYMYDALHLKRVCGSASSLTRAGIVDYSARGYCEPFDYLCSVTQHELSHIFGIKEDCEEEWCVMNGPEGDSCYMPHEEGYWFIVWWIKTNETWATDWGPICKQTLIQTYDGCVIPRSKFEVFKMGMYACGKSWTEEYIHWNLTRSTLNGFFGITFIDYRPPSSPFGDGAGHPTVTLNWNFKTIP